MVRDVCSLQAALDLPFVWMARDVCWQPAAAVPPGMHAPDIYLNRYINIY